MEPKVVKTWKNNGNNALKYFVDVAIGNGIVLHGVKVFQGNDGNPFIRLPSTGKKGKNGDMTYYPAVSYEKDEDGKMTSAATETAKTIDEVVLAAVGEQKGDNVPF